LLLTEFWNTGKDSVGPNTTWTVHGQSLAFALKGFMCVRIVKADALFFGMNRTLAW
jgi:hypothetical protein